MCLNTVRLSATPQCAWCPDSLRAEHLASNGIRAQACLYPALALTLSPAFRSCARTQAVTATACAEQMAVATIVAYDIYKPYINKNADGKTMITLQRVMVVVYAIISGVISVILLKLEVSLGWVYLFMGIVIGSAVFPVSYFLVLMLSGTAATWPRPVRLVFVWGPCLAAR